MSAEAELRRKIGEYLASIDAADTELAGAVWETSDRVSFIHPRGHEYGWDEVAKNFYGITMGATFRQRSLRLDGEPRITIYDGGAAVVEFEWTFVALRVDNGETLRTRGRESQVFIANGQDWKLVHVHYSGPPVTGAGQGF
ncbi:nuclear transport factor 2 family protein [Mycolicibacterium boenickei]